MRDWRCDIACVLQTSDCSHIREYAHMPCWWGNVFLPPVTISHYRQIKICFQNRHCLFLIECLWKGAQHPLSASVLPLSSQHHAGWGRVGISYQRTLLFRNGASVSISNTASAFKRVLVHLSSSLLNYVFFVCFCKFGGCLQESPGPFCMSRICLAASKDRWTLWIAKEWDNMGKLLWGTSLSEMTRCCQYVPVAIPSRYTDTEMIYATVTKAVNVESLSLPSTVKSAGPKVCRWVGMDLKPNCSFTPMGWGMKRGVCFAFAGTRTSAESGARTYTLRRGWNAAEQEQLQQNLCAFVCNASRAAERRGMACTGEQPQSSRESFFLFTWRNFVAWLKEFLHFLWKVGCNRPGKWCVKRLG